MGSLPEQHQQNAMQGFNRRMVAPRRFHPSFGKKPSLLCRGLQKIEAVEVQHDSALQQPQRPAADTGDYLAIQF